MASDPEPIDLSAYRARLAAHTPRLGSTRRSPSDAPQAPMPGEEFVKEGAYLEGPVQCLSCSHVWQHRYPIGDLDGHQCPSCSLYRGVSQGLFSLPPEAIVWHCGACRSIVFHVTTRGFFCLGCGKEQSF